MKKNNEKNLSKRQFMLKSEMAVAPVFRVLLRWITYDWDKTHSYDDLCRESGYKSTRTIGCVLNKVEHTLRYIEEIHKKRVPTLAGLVSNKITKLPSCGMEEAVKGWNKMNNEQKKIIVNALNKEAMEYDWGWIIDELYLRY